MADMHFDEWQMSSNFAPHDATELLDADTGDRIGYFAVPLLLGVGTSVLLAGGYEASVVDVTVDLSEAGAAARVYLQLSLSDRDGFWSYRRAMATPLGDQA